jgi:dTDP-4-amino-4,6-dideoxygalactose transaminase
VVNEILSLPIPPHLKEEEIINIVDEIVYFLTRII